MRGNDLEELEVRLLLEAVRARYGYDYRDYAPASLRRRVRKRVAEEGLASVSGLSERILHDPECFRRLRLDFSVPATSMFRDPPFFRALREKVLPVLRTYPHVRVWSAGCSTGEETWSLAILMHEEGLGDRCRFYATDINETLVERARAGRFPLKQMGDYETQYHQASGKRSLTDYYVTEGHEAVFHLDLVDRAVFAQHDLATDAPFNEFHLVLCRNVMIYFQPDLQRRVHGLLYRSLAHFGFLGLGERESTRLSVQQAHYEALDADWKLYRRVA